MNEVKVGGEGAAATGGSANNRSGYAIAAVMVVLTGVLAYCAGRIDGQLAERERVVGELRAERIAVCGEIGGEGAAATGNVGAMEVR